ncbi:MAG: hypothetical protein JOS17DRAFT_805254 [Linnemannia elongata]|nr:MAG: hypothetical protein JOS17DRAFT_805254 [Linnemannia elongata]
MYVHRAVFMNTPFSDACKAAASIDIGLMQSLELHELSIDFTGPVPTLSSDAVSAVLADIGVPWIFTEAQVSVTIVDNGVDVGSFSSDYSPAIATDRNKVLSKVNNCAISISATQRDAFASFVASLLFSVEHTFLLRGAIGAKLGSPVAAVAHSIGGLGLGGFGDGLVDAASAVTGSVAVSGVGFTTSITVDGLNGLSTGTFVKKISHTLDANGFNLFSLVNIDNPSSQLTIKMGDMTFKTLDSAGNLVGVSVISSFTFVPGTNTVVLVTTSKNPDILKGLMEKPDIWTLLGTPTSDTSPLTAKGFANVKLSIAIPVLTA